MGSVLDLIPCPMYVECAATFDTTIPGSRNGAIPFMVYHELIRVGESQMRARTSACLEVADYLVQRLTALRHEPRWAKALKFAPWHPPGVMCVNVSPPPKHLMTKYHLPLFSVVGKAQSTHILCMEHVQREQIDALLQEWDACLLSEEQPVSSTASDGQLGLLTSRFHRLPLAGFGTFKLHGAECAASVAAAVTSGHQLIDTAHVYKNLEHIGTLPASVTLVHKVDHHVTNGKELAISFDEDLQRLGRESVDVCMLHYFPKEHCHRQDMWTAVLNEKRRGRAKLTGVSNFSVEQLLLLFGNEQQDFWPDVLQVNATQFPEELASLCSIKHVDLMVYNVMGSEGDLSSAQRFLSRRIVVLVSSSREQHIASNAEQLAKMVQTPAAKNSSATSRSSSPTTPIRKQLEIS